MKYELDATHRTPQWYYLAGQSMLQKQSKLQARVHQIKSRLFDKENPLSFFDRGKLNTEKNGLERQMLSIDKAFNDRRQKLQRMAEHLRAFEMGYNGQKFL